MEHRKRSLMQHKVELSTLLKMVIAKKKPRPVSQNKIYDRRLVTTLATKAVELQKNNDNTCVAEDLNEKVYLKKTGGIKTYKRTFAIYTKKDA